MMASIETFLETPEAVSPARTVLPGMTVLPGTTVLPGKAPASYDVAVLSIAQADGFLPDWRALAAEAIEDNPFLSPAFLSSALAYEAEPLAVSLAAVWRQTEDIRKLVGLFPLRPVAREFKMRWPMASRSALWCHPLQPVGTPLLAGDVTMAGEVIAAFLSWLSMRRPRLDTFEASALPMDGIVSRLLLAEAERRSLIVRCTPDAAHSHGFHLPASLPEIDATHVKILRQPRDVREGIETFLCLDAKTCSSQNRDALVSAPGDAAFLRGVSRSLSIENRLAVGLFDNGKHAAAALFVEGRQQTFLWNFVGAPEAAPGIEAALASAAGLVIGKPVVAATPRPVAGFWTLPLLTATLQIGLTPTPGAIAGRLRRQMSTFGIF